MKKVFIVTPLVVFLIAYLGGIITSSNLDWYFGLDLPAIAPDGFLIGIAWTVIYILSTISFINFYLNSEREKYFKTIIYLFILNALLNFYWTFIFFGMKLIAFSVIEIVFLNLTNIALIVLLFKRNFISSILLIPYFLWVSFATYLNYLVFVLNH